MACGENLSWSKRSGMLTKGFRVMERGLACAEYPLTERCYNRHRLRQDCKRPYAEMEVNRRIIWQLLCHYHFQEYSFE